MLLLPKIAAALGLILLSLAACSRQPDPREIPGANPACALSLAALDAHVRSNHSPLPEWSLRPLSDRQSWQPRATDPLLRQGLWAGEPSMWFAAHSEEPAWYALRRGLANYADVPGPSPTMVRAYLDAVQVDGGTCSGIHDYAASAGALRSRTPRYASLWFRERYDADLRIERAVLSPAGDEAIVYLAEDVGLLIYYRKQADGHWREVAQTTVWIS